MPRLFLVDIEFTGWVRKDKEILGIGDYEKLSNKRKMSNTKELFVIYIDHKWCRVYSTILENNE